jgi:hypothetical protein
MSKSSYPITTLPVIRIKLRTKMKARLMGFLPALFRFVTKLNSSFESHFLENKKVPIKETFSLARLLGRFPNI